MTGSMPGIAASTSETWVLGSPPKAVDAPEKSFDFEVTWAWISMPMTTSQSPVEPLISLPLVTVISVLLRRAPRQCAPTRLQAYPSPRAGRPGDTNSRHCRDRLPRGADRHAPRRRPCSIHPGRSYAPDPSCPWRPTTARPAEGSASAPVCCLKGWLSDPPCSPPFRRGEAAGGLLDHLAERKQGFLVEGTADQLQAERKPLAVLARGYRNARQARHVHGHREDVVEVHLDGIGAALLADAERRRRRRRCQDRRDALGKTVLEVLLDQRAHLLGAQVIGVVIAGREYIGADHDAAAHFRAKPLRASVLVHVDDVLAGFTQAVAHAVIAREVGGSLRRGHNVVGRQRVFGVRQRDLDELGAGRLQPGRALAPELFNFGRHAVEAILPGNADLHAIDGLADRRLVVGHSDIDRGGVLRVMPGHRAHQDRGVAVGTRDRPRLIERRGKGNDAPARAAAIGRLDADGRRERRRLADRAAGVRRGRA